MAEQKKNTVPCVSWSRCLSVAFLFSPEIRSSSLLSKSMKQTRAHKRVAIFLFNFWQLFITYGKWIKKEAKKWKIIKRSSIISMNSFVCQVENFHCFDKFICCHHRAHKLIICEWKSRAKIILLTKKKKCIKKEFTLRPFTSTFRAYTNTLSAFRLKSLFIEIIY